MIALHRRWLPHVAGSATACAILIMHAAHCTLQRLWRIVRRAAAAAAPYVSTLRVGDGDGSATQCGTASSPLTARCRALRDALIRAFLGFRCGLSVAHSEAGRRTIGRAVDLVRTSLGAVHPATSVCGRREQHTHTHTHTHGESQEAVRPCSLRQSNGPHQLKWRVPRLSAAHRSRTRNAIGA